MSPTTAAAPPASPAVDAPISKRRFWLHVGLAVLALILGAWLSSGTLTPYGTYAQGPCHYRLNGDHWHFRAVYAMLAGKPAHVWSFSVVLRRILHPLLAFPLMKAFGFDLGGFLFNILALVIAQIGLAVAIRRFFDARAAVLVVWLFASYPGYAYWVGLPYAYGFIVPGSVLAVIMLMWLHERPSTRRAVAAAFVIGFVGLGYDLIPAFGGALLLMLLFQRRWLDLVLAVLTLAAWVAFIGRGLPAIFGFPALNSNTQVYVSIVGSWLDAWNHLAAWAALLLDAPGALVGAFFYSNFIFFPVLLLALLAARWRLRLRPVIPRVALAILLSELALFLFLNLSPPYDGMWQMRGAWIARLYQPWFVAVPIVVAATSLALRGTRYHKLLIGAVVLVAALDGAVIAGPFIGLTSLYGGVYQRFYRVHGHNQNAAWLRKLGRRPYGICQ